MQEDDQQTDCFDLDSIDEIGPATKSRLEESGFKSIKDLIVRGPADVAEATGMEIEKSNFLCNKARIRLEELGIIDKSFVTATKLYEKRKQEERISTGSKNLNDLFVGGSSDSADQDSFLTKYFAGRQLSLRGLLTRTDPP